MYIYIYIYVNSNFNGYAIPRVPGRRRPRSEVLKDLGGEVESLRVKAKAENSMCKRNEVPWVTMAA